MNIPKMTTMDNTCLTCFTCLTCLSCGPSPALAAGITGLVANLFVG